MIGLLVVTHGGFGHDLVRAAEMILGPLDRVAAVALEHGDDMPTAARTVEKTFKQVDGGDGVIIFTDLLGGTPSNVSLTFLNRPQVEVISGVNLPMLLKAITIRESRPLREAVTLAMKSGGDGITAASLMLNRKDGRP